MHDIHLRASSGVRASISADGLVLLDLDGGLVLSSNAVGGRIWQLVEQRRTPREIARQVAAEYEVAEARAQADVAAFIAALVARGLLAEEQKP